MREKTIVRRRALLAGGLGAIVGTTTAGLKNPSSADATGEYVRLGEENHATADTAIISDTAENTLFLRTQNGTALMTIADGGRPGIVSSATGPAVWAESGHSEAVMAHSAASPAVWAESSAPSGVGVHAYTMEPGSVGVLAEGHSSGVKGVSLFENGSGVRGIAWSGDGAGVYGEATRDAAGVLGRSQLGFAIRGDGRIKFDKVSGTAKIPAGGTAVTITPGVNIHRDSFMLLTPMANIGSRGLWFSRNTTSNTVTIHISSPRNVATAIAWLLLG